MRVDLVDYMGNDLTVVNAARVSFHKESDWETVDPVNGEGHAPCLSYQDDRLISYLATHNHWTPFSHPMITLRMKTPIFVARQLFKHKVGMTENEVSRRYVDDTPEFYYPDKWRGRPSGGAKQGSSSEEVSTMLFHGIEECWVGEVGSFYANFIESAERLYNNMIEAGVAPEQARMVLPQSMYTEWYWTGSLASYARICKLRLDPHAQSETREVAQMISDIIQPLFPVSWKALCD